MKQFSPAKINLYLHITGRRPDGFHELDTLMAPLSFGDELDIDLIAKDIELTCSNTNLPPNTDNLAYRAAKAFFEEFKIQSGVRIHLEKRIPIGAGLGGGSSNAAAVLLALRKLCRPEIANEDLRRVAAALGSDVPFFIFEQPARCLGRGEIVQPVSLKGDYWGLLVHPGFGVSTPWAYKTYAQKPSKGIEGKKMPDAFILRNDLESPAFGKYVWLPTVKKWFQEQPEVMDSLMSGSGSSVFALTQDPKQISSLQSRFAEMFGAEIFATPFSVLKADPKSKTQPLEGSFDVAKMA